MFSRKNVLNANIKLKNYNSNKNKYANRKVLFNIC